MKKFYECIIQYPWITVFLYIMILTSRETIKSKK